MSGIRVITNGEALQDLIHSIIKSISNFKESEASEPFRVEIDSLELKLIETNKKIDIIKKVESIFGIVSEVSTSYSLDLQLGKFQQKLSILTDIWRNIHQVQCLAIRTDFFGFSIQNAIFKRGRILPKCNAKSTNFLSNACINVQSLKE